MNFRTCILAAGCAALSGCSAWQADFPITKERSPMITLSSDQSADVLKVSRANALALGQGRYDVTAPTVDYVVNQLTATLPVEVQLKLVYVDSIVAMGEPAEVSCLASFVVAGKSMTTSSIYQADLSDDFAWIEQATTPCLDHVSAQMQAAIDTL